LSAFAVLRAFFQQSAHLIGELTKEHPMELPTLKARDERNGRIAKAAGALAATAILLGTAAFLDNVIADKAVASAQLTRIQMVSVTVGVGEGLQSIGHTNARMDTKIAKLETELDVMLNYTTPETRAFMNDVRDKGFEQGASRKWSQVQLSAAVQALDLGRSDLVEIASADAGMSTFDAIKEKAPLAVNGAASQEFANQFYTVASTMADMGSNYGGSGTQALVTSLYEGPAALQQHYGIQSPAPALDTTQFVGGSPMDIVKGRIHMAMGSTIAKSQPAPTAAAEQEVASAVDIKIERVAVHASDFTLGKVVIPDGAFDVERIAIPAASLQVKRIAIPAGAFDVEQIPVTITANPDVEGFKRIAVAITANPDLDEETPAMKM
jgi:hypothetical protein